MGAWIEILGWMLYLDGKVGRPRMGAWIEIRRSLTSGYSKLGSPPYGGVD